ncbi:MAG TPA: hypothetical protein G4O04_00245 [Anaerolineae bacterium]|nr:hypothetical protein [Anaerolineae bacterium]HID84894.1 hypothetical protein [Anaerolineales bacterium]HIQ07934.1 hypothetical protein [Anaerolineaceae bacterium]
MENTEERKITIIEGPTPTFEPANEDWLLGQVEGPSLSRLAFTQVRALNGPELINRCYRAWHAREPIHLEFRDPSGLIRRVPIVAARHLATDEGDVLQLWVYTDEPDIIVEYSYYDEEEDDEDEDASDGDWLTFDEG